MTAPGSAPQREPEFAVGTVKGLRSWRLIRDPVKDEPWLRSASMQYRWTDGVNTARHLSSAGLLTEPHRPAKFWCSCGFYAYYRDAERAYHAETHGVIEGWGRTVLGSKGFRCEKARIVALVAPDPSDDSNESFLTRRAMRLGQDRAQHDLPEQWLVVSVAAAALCCSAFLGTLLLSPWFVIMTVVGIVLSAWSVFRMKVLIRAREIFLWTSRHEEWAHLRPTRTTLSAEEARRLYPGVRCYNTLDEMIANEEISEPDVAQRDVLREWG